MKSGEAAAIPANPAPNVSELQAAMGTVFEILIYGSDRRNLSAAARQALHEIVNLDEQLSRWKVGSDISWINGHAAEEPVRVEPELFHLLLRSREIWLETKGAFDITVAPLVKAWGFFDKKPRMPTAEEIKSVLEIVGMQHVRFNEDDSTVFFDRKGVEIDLGGIGKGYAVDRAVEVLESCRVEAALVNSGTSTIYAIGYPPGQEAWHIGIRDPSDEERAIAVVGLKDGSLSTSGAPEKVFEIAGKSYSHILDPRTGFPVEGMVSATVVARSGADTDALATSFFVLGPEGAKEYCKAHEEVKAVLIPMTKSRDKPTIITVNFNR